MVEVARLERERLDIEMRLKGLQAGISGAKTDLRSRLMSGDASASGGGVIITDVRLQANASLHLSLQAQRVALELAGAYKRVELARTHLLEATTARKAVEVLKDRRHQEWKHEQSRREFAQLDEVLSTRPNKLHIGELP